MGLNLNIDFVRAMSDEIMWDDYFEEFKTMVGYAEDLLNSTITHLRWTVRSSCRFILRLSSARMDE
jgi:hypothetical protein